MDERLPSDKARRLRPAIAQLFTWVEWTTFIAAFLFVAELIASPVAKWSAYALILLLVIDMILAIYGAVVDATRPGDWGKVAALMAAGVAAIVLQVVAMRAAADLVTAQRGLDEPTTEAAPPPPAS